MRNIQRIRRALLTSIMLLPVVACAPNPPVMMTSAPTSVETTATYESLRNLPAPKRPVSVAVYSYPDLTGQFKPSDSVSTNSRAVTQGAVWMLVKALKDAAGGQWFKVSQRVNLESLLQERQIIRETRGRIEKATGKPQPGLPSLMFAGVILEGGIIGYDSNTVTGGLGARYLGIGGDVQYRQDTVTVYLNAISSQSGEVLKSVMTRKTVASYGVRGSVFKFVAFQKLLEGETGYTINEPGQIAVAQAIEHAVRAMIVEGALEGLWQFEDDVAGKRETQAYLADKDDNFLIGDSTSEAALALLTDEQLQELAKRRKASQRQTATAVAHAGDKKTETPKAAPPSALAAVDKPATTSRPDGHRSERRLAGTQDALSKAAQKRLAETFSSENQSATQLDFNLKRLPQTTPAPKRTTQRQSGDQVVIKIAPAFQPAAATTPGIGKAKS